MQIQDPAFASKSLSVFYGSGTLAVKSLRKTIYRSNNAMAVKVHLIYPDGEEEDMPLSVNFNDGQETLSQDLPEGAFFVKIYEPMRQSIYQALVKAQWLVPTGQWGKNGFIQAPVCKIGPKAIIEE